MSEQRITTLTIVVKAIAPHLLLLCEDISVFGQAVELLILAEEATIGIEVLAIFRVPDICIAEELGVVRVEVIDYRVALHLVLIVAHLYPINADNLLSISVIVATLRLQAVIIIDNHSATCKCTDIGLCVECKVVGVHRCSTIYNLDDIRVYLSLVFVAIILCAVAIDKGCTLVNQHLTEALKVGIRIANSTVTSDNSTVMVCCEVTHSNKHLFISSLGLPTRIRLHIDIVIALLGLLCLPLRRAFRQARHTTATRKDDTRCCCKEYQYGYYNPMHYLLFFTQFLFANSPSRYSGAI